MHRNKLSWTRPECFFWPIRTFWKVIMFIQGGPGTYWAWQRQEHQHDSAVATRDTYIHAYLHTYANTLHKIGKQLTEHSKAKAVFTFFFLLFYQLDTICCEKMSFFKSHLQYSQFFLVISALRNPRKKKKKSQNWRCLIPFLKLKK